MPSIKPLLASACLLLAAFAAPASACTPPDKTPAPAANGSPAEDQALLDALIERRARLARTGAESADKTAALAFLDERIAELKSRLGN